MRLPGTIVFRRVTFATLLSSLVERSVAASYMEEVCVVAVGASAAGTPWWVVAALIMLALALLVLELAVLWLLRRQIVGDDEIDVPPPLEPIEFGGRC